MSHVWAKQTAAHAPGAHTAWLNLLLLPLLLPGGQEEKG